MKWTNRLVIGLVIVLLTLVALLLISTLYYSTDKKMELGSLTDWISAGANILMAGSAVYAAMKAVHFFKEKAIDHAYNLLAQFNDVKVDLEMFHFDLISTTTLRLQPYRFESNGVNLEINEEFAMMSEKLKELDDRLTF
ncbi:TPA: hypothetical protein ACXIY6_003749 [Serratia marcescens]